MEGNIENQFRPAVSIIEKERILKLADLAVSTHHLLTTPTQEKFYA